MISAKIIGRFAAARNDAVSGPISRLDLTKIEIAMMKKQPKKVYSNKEKLQKKIMVKLK